MSDYDNTNTGVLFKNDEKKTAKHPDYRGSLNVYGDEFWLSAWIKEGKKGKFMSLAIQPKEQKRQESRRQSAPVGHEDFEDDLPFAPRRDLV